MKQGNQQLPDLLYTAAQVRLLDKTAIDDFGIPGYTLMCRAAQAAFVEAQIRWPRIQNVLVFCGLGNNAGDGYVFARFALQGGLQVRVIQLGDPDSLKGDALRAKQDMEAVGISCEPFFEQDISQAELIVDALLGTGLTRNVVGPWLSAINVINAAKVPTLAIDIPSGLHADTGQVMDVAVVAHVTVAFIGLKQGMFCASCPDYCGDIVFNDLEVPSAVYQSAESHCLRLSNVQQLALFPARKRNSHKGDFGHALLLGGNQGMSGAIQMAAQAAARVGAGLVTVGTYPDHAQLINLRQPELMSYGITVPHDVTRLLQQASVAALGPGLGQDAWAKQVFDVCVEMDLPMVLDADGLNILATQSRQSSQWILTPHPGEAARLLGCSVAEVQSDRFHAAIEIQRRYGGVCVLKGSGTLICDKQHFVLCDAGNPGMASGGMGDVLTGVLVGLLAQGMKVGYSLLDIAQYGVVLHAQAGDIGAEQGERGLLASDVITQLRYLNNHD